MPVLDVLDSSSDPITLGPAPDIEDEVSLLVLPGSGSVIIEVINLDTGAFYLPADPEHTITYEGIVTLKRGKQPPIRISATGDCRYAFFGDPWPWG